MHVQTKKDDMIQSNFELKGHEKNLVQKIMRKTEVSLSSLEAIRISRECVTASNYGLESICGASCETGAW